MIVSWKIVSDDLEEDGDPSGATTIQAQVKPLAGEEIEQTISRGQNACYSHFDAQGFNCIRGTPHPRNAFRLSQGHRPIFCKSFSVKEDRKNPLLYAVTLNWDIPENVSGELNLEREPPRRIQHVIPRISTHDPTTGEPHTTTAGELIRNIQSEPRYAGFSYRWRVPQLPGWFDLMQSGPMNNDTVRLDGKSYQPKTLWVASCVADVVPVRPGVYWREIQLDILHDPETWQEKYPNIGHYELLLYGMMQTRSVSASGRVIYRTTKRTEIMPHIRTQADADKYAEAARTGRAINVPGTGLVKIYQAYVPIRTFLKQPYGVTPPVEIEDVTRPVPIDRNGLAFREDVDGSPLKTTGIPTSSIHIVKLNTRPQARLAQIGLW